MSNINLGREQRGALQIRSLPIGRHAHVVNQHRRITIKKNFPHDFEAFQILL